MLKRLKIRSKLLIICTVSIVTCAALVFSIAAQEHKNSYAELVQDSLLAMTENFADDLLLLMSETDDPFVIRAQLLRFEKYKHVRSASVYSPSGELLERYISPSLLASGILPAQPVFHPKASDIKGSSSELSCIRPIGEASNPLGFVYIVHDFEQPVAQSLKDLLYTALPAVVVVLLASLVITYLTFSSMLTPLINLALFTNKVEKTGNFKLKFNVTGNDEVSTLATSVNDMLTTIEYETERNLKQQQVMYDLANYDQLTGLPNRRHVMKKLEQYLQEGADARTDFAVIFFDLDDFKSVNDRMGHDIGDKLLLAVSQTVQRCLGKEDIFARLGGDEFLIISPQRSAIDTINALANCIQAQFEAPINLERWVIHTSLSMGITFASTALYNRDTVISNADIAMYEAKSLGKGHYVIFQEEMLKKNQRRVQIISHIPYALENHEFQLVYQPKIASSGTVTGLEALIRWESPQLGFVSPGEFIPIAESGGQIGYITKWVIQKVINDLSQIKMLCGEDIRISLNISSEDLKNEWLESYILSVVCDRQQLFHNIQFEITESSYLGDIAHANQFFANIRRHGGSIALDDFGTGFSSLSYLTQIEIDTLKIDRKFIHNCLNTQKDRLILQSILRLSSNIGLNTCCEGIETPEQAIHLLENGCDEMQGYYFAKPCTLDALPSTIANAQNQFERLNDFSYGQTM